MPDGTFSAIVTTNDGYRSLSIPEFAFDQLQEDEQRFFILEPSTDHCAHVRCKLSIYPLYDAPPFIAVKNARGFRLLSTLR